MKKLLCSIASIILLAGQASAGPITVPAWTTLTAGDKVFTKVSATASLNTADVEAFDASPLYILNLSNLAAITTNSVLRYSISITDPLQIFDTFRVSENDALGNTTAGTLVELFSNAAFTNLLFSDALLLTDTTPVYTFTNAYNKIYVRYTTSGVNSSNRLNNISSDVTQQATGNLTAAVPEPSSIVLCGLGVLGIVLARSRNKAK